MMRILSPFVVLLAVGCTQAAPVAAQPTSLAADPALDDPLVGTSPPEWKTEAWLNSKPLTLAELRGKVVMVRWFMGTSCPMCSATAPSLRKMDEAYRDKGLVVIGMYHHKDDEPLTEATYGEYIRAFGFRFPVARDPEWTTLKAWWLTTGKKERDFTSVTFLLDKQGRTRAIHQGGRWAPGDADYQAMDRAVQKLLAEST